MKDKKPPKHNIDFYDPPHHELNFEYNQITENIFIGTNLCCQVHFNEELIEKGVTIDISLDDEKVDTPFGVEHFSWIPTKDKTPPTPDQIRVGVDILNRLVKQGKKIYVHCRFGHGRAPTLVAAHLIEQGVGVRESLLQIKDKRSTVHPTEAQIEALEEFAESAGGR